MLCGSKAFAREATYFSISTAHGKNAEPSAPSLGCEADEHYLLLGILSSEFEDGNTSYRVFNRSNGYTQIAGGTITTEQIQDANRQLIIDFQSNPPRIIARGGAEIIGNITFKAADNNYYNIDQYLDGLVDDIKVGGRNLAIYTTAQVSNNCSKDGNYGFLYTGTGNAYFRIYGIGATNTLYLSQRVTEAGTYSERIVLAQSTNSFRIYGSSIGYGMFTLAETLPAGTELVVSITLTNVISGSISWKNVQIERGTIATDWTPAPEDDDTNFGGDNLIGEPNPLEMPLVAGNNYHYRLLVGSYAGVPDTWKCVNTDYLENGATYVFSVGKVVQNATGMATTQFTVAPYDFETKTFSSRTQLDISTERQTCTFTIPATGNWCLLIYNGLWGSTAGNNLVFYDLMLQKGTKASAYQTYVKSVTAALQGTTDINGGLLLTNVMQLKNEAGTVTAGMSGLDADGTLLWGGGTYLQAIQALAGSGKLPVLLTKQGMGSNVGCFKVLDNNTVVIDGDENGEDQRIVITDKSLGDFEPQETLQQDVVGTASLAYREYDMEYGLANTGTSESSIVGMKKVDYSCTINCTISRGGKYETSQISNLISLYVTAQTGNDNNYSSYKITLYSTIALTGVKVHLINNGKEVKTYSVNGLSKTISTTVTKSNGSITAGSTTTVASTNLFSISGTQVELEAGTLQIKLTGTFSMTVTKYYPTGYVHNYLPFVANFQIKANTSTLTVTGLDRSLIIANNGIGVIVNSDCHFYVYNSGDTLDVRMKGLPMSMTDLSDGQLYKNGNYLMIKNSS